MSTSAEYLGRPTGLRPEDEGLHAPPPEAADGLWGDTVWLSAIDPAQGIWGINHMHVSANRGYARYQSLFWIDGVAQAYTGKSTGNLVAGQTRWSDGRMTYEVLEPFERVRVTMNHSAFAFDLMYTARHV